MPEISKIEEAIGNYQNRYRISLKKKVDYMKLEFEKCMQNSCYKNPLDRINEKYINIDNLIKGCAENISKKLMVLKKDFGSSIMKLDALSPLKTLTRGFSITRRDEKIIKLAKELKKGDKISIRFSDGETSAEII